MVCQILHAAANRRKIEAKAQDSGQGEVAQAENDVYEQVVSEGAATPTEGRRQVA